jgi:glycosyltransferase involved in cell wall biosynthesis
LSQLQASWRERMGLLSRFGSWTTNIVHIRRIRRTALTAAQAAESANSQLASISGEISSLRGEISPLRGEIAGIRVELGKVKEGLRRLRRRDSVLFVGYAEGGLGLGETFRSMLEALYESGMEFSIYPFRRNIENRLGAPFLPELYDRHGIYDISVAYMATDQLPHYYEELEAQLESGSYNVLRTYWELPKAPTEWRKLLARIDELWVPNSFVQNAFSSIFDGVVSVIPPIVSVKNAGLHDRAYFGLDKSTFYFLFSFDFYSSAVRKNPLGVVQAFAYAFPDQQRKIGLIIKSIGPGEHDPTAFQQLQNVTRIDNRIKLLTQVMRRDEMLSLISVSDCYISLHRSEGFGAGMAEAMALEKPVIGTDFSGNAEFLTQETGFPVHYTLRKLMPGEYAYGEGQSWAEPDLEEAIRHMRGVVDDPADAARRAIRGKLYIEAHYSAETIAERIGVRIAEIRRDRQAAEVVIEARAY